MKACLQLQQLFCSRENQLASRVLWFLSNCHKEHSNPQCHNCSWKYECQAQSGLQHSVFSDETSSNGCKLLDLLTKGQLIVLNTCFHKQKWKLWTFKFPNRGRSQIDYILLNKKWRNSARNCEAYSTFISIGSDHQIVAAEIKLILHANMKAHKVMQYDWSKLIDDKDIQSQYSIAVKTSSVH